MTRARHRVAVAGCLLALVPSLAACSSEPDVCEDVDALRSSVADLRSITIGEDALPDLKAGLQDVRTELRRLDEDASAEYSAEVGEVRSRLAALEETLDEASAAPSAAAFADVVAEVGAVGGAVGDLGDAIGDTC